MAGFSIKELEILSGIKAHTIRIWEQRYAFLKPSRSKTNIRFYTQEELKKLLQVSLLNNCGFKVSLIDKMLPEELEKRIAGLTSISVREAFTVNELFIKLFSLDINGFEKLLDAYIKENNIATAILNIIGPFLTKIELLRTEVGLKREYEQLMMNIIRKNLIAGIQQLQFANTDTKMVISFLPENHHYEIELLYMQYLLKRKGLNVIYLGANVPVKDVISITGFKKPDFVHMHLSAAAQSLNAHKFLEKLAAKFPGITIVITGSQLQNYKQQIPVNIKLQSSVHEAVHLIA